MANKQIPFSFKKLVFLFLQRLHWWLPHWEQFPLMILSNDMVSHAEQIFSMHNPHLSIHNFCSVISVNLLHLKQSLRSQKLHLNSLSILSIYFIHFMHLFETFSEERSNFCNKDFLYSFGLGTCNIFDFRLRNIESENMITKIPQLYPSIWYKFDL